MTPRSRFGLQLVTLHLPPKSLFSFERYTLTARNRVAKVTVIVQLGICLCAIGCAKAFCQDSQKQSSPSTEVTAPAPSLPFYPLDAVMVPGENTALVVDRNLPGVWRWQAGKMEIFAQGSKKFRQPLNAVRCLALDHNGVLLVGDTSTRDIYRVEPGGKFTPITGGGIGIPMDIAVKADGTIYVADLETQYLLRIAANTANVERVAQVNPRGVFVDSQQQVWVVSQNAQQLLVVADDGKSEVIVDGRQFEFPHQVVVNSAGEAFVSDGYKKSIWKVIRGSKPTQVVQGPPLDNPVGLAIKDDRIYVVDPRACKVFELTKESKLIESFSIAP